MNNYLVCPLYPSLHIHSNEGAFIDLSVQCCCPCLSLVFLSRLLQSFALLRRDSSCESIMPLIKNLILFQRQREMANIDAVGPHFRSPSIVVQTDTCDVSIRLIDGACFAVMIKWTTIKKERLYQHQTYNYSYMSTANFVGNPRSLRIILTFPSTSGIMFPLYQRTARHDTQRTLLFN